MPLQSSNNNISVDVPEDGSGSIKSARSPATMREDECFLSIVTADLDSFCATYESHKDDNCASSPVIVFPSVDRRHRKLIHALLSQRYHYLAHASYGVEPDRRPVAIYRSFLLKCVLPARFNSFQSGLGGMTYSEFAFCLALLECCRDSAEAKRLVETLYAFRLADQRIPSPLISDKSRHTSDSATFGIPPSSKGRNRAVKPGCERYVPRPLRALRAASEDKSADFENGEKFLTRCSTADVIATELRQKMRICTCSSSSSSPSDSPITEARRTNNVATANGKTASRSKNIKSAPDTASQQRKLSSTSQSSNASNSNLTSIRFLGDFVGKSTDVIHLPVERYSAYRSEPPPLDYEALSHVLEISGFPKDWRGADLQRFLPVATFIHWVDDTHALAVFKSPTEAKSFRAPPEVYITLKVRAMKNATVESQYKAYRIFDDLIGRLRKPQTNTAVVRRILNHHLHLGLSRPSPLVTTTTTSNAINNNDNNTSNIASTASPLVSGAARNT